MNTRPNHRQGPDSYYRAYLIGSANRIEHAVELDAATDEEATVQAQQLVDGHAVEVWDRSRKLIRFESKEQ